MCDNATKKFSDSDNNLHSTTVFGRVYMAEWGANGRSRLHKMAHCRASFTKNFKYQDDDKFDEAIRQWEEDLGFLYDKYYVGRFGVGWPSTSV